MTTAPAPEPGERAAAPGDLRLIQQFVNTVDLEENGKEELVDPAALRAWLIDHALIEPSATVDAAAFARMLALREAIRALLLVNTGEPPDPAAIETLNHVAAETPFTVAFAPNGATRLTSPAAGVEGIIAALLAVIYTAKADGSWVRLKACVRQTCKWAFYDASKNRSGHWCSMAVCGNRTKVRAYQARKRGQVAGR